MKHSQLKQLIKEEIRSTLNEGIGDKVLDKILDIVLVKIFYMALKRLVEKSSKNLDQNYEVLGWIESLLDHMRPDKKG